jgi:hypothetical protein
MYEGYSCQVIHYGKRTHSFPITNGVRQGCIISPLIFILVMDDIIRRVTADKKRGIRWGLMDTLEHLEYADDLCLLAHRFSHMQETICKFETDFTSVTVLRGSRVSKFQSTWTVHVILLYIETKPRILHHHYLWTLPQSTTLIFPKVQRSHANRHPPRHKPIT